MKVITWQQTQQLCNLLSAIDVPFVPVPVFNEKDLHLVLEPLIHLINNLEKIHNEQLQRDRGV